MSEIKVNSIKGVAASAAAISVDNSNGTCTLASVSKLNNCTTDGTTNFSIADGNLVISTSGHGIDFSATPDPGQTGTTQENELFSDYEEGTWSPEYNAGSASSACFAGGVSYSAQVGVYRKIGKMVYFILKIQASSGTAKSGQLQINRLPFSAGDFSSNATAGGAYITLTNAFTGTAHMPTAFISGSQSNIKFFQTNANAWAGTDLDTPTGFIHMAGMYPTPS